MRANAAILGAVAAFAMEPARAHADRSPSRSATLADYFGELERGGLVDIETGSQSSLTEELRAAQRLIHTGALLDAAVALYAIVESPRYAGFEDFVEFQGAQYYLGVALARSGAYEAAFDYLFAVLERGPTSFYFVPAYRVVVDVALESRRIQPTAQRLTELKFGQALPASALGEKAYLEGRLAYQRGDFPRAEKLLSSISRRSRLYSSGLYLRGVMRTRSGDFRAAAEALCEVVDTPDDDTFSFVVDDRYFALKDLARLGLGRIAHEVGDYDDAYYHYFQVPEDSDRLAEALFEASWSMYQKRELATARDLVAELLTQFPASPVVPEARLLAGYIELADCQFDAAKRHYDRLVVDLEPVLRELSAVRVDPERRRGLLAQALLRQVDSRQGQPKKGSRAPLTPRDRTLALLRLDPEFVRLHEAVSGLRRASGGAALALRSWRQLSHHVAARRVGAIREQEDPSAIEANDALALLADVRQLRRELDQSRRTMRSQVRAGRLARRDAETENARLAHLEREIELLEAEVDRAADETNAESVERSPANLKPLLREDIREAEELEESAHELLIALEREAGRRAARSVDNLYDEVRRIVDKAKLGTIDAVIGQKRRLEIEVEDLALGRFPPELHGQLWEEGLIGDDEEYWPFEGEFWADEYEGWR